MTTVELIYTPGYNELILFKRCAWITMGKTDFPNSLPSSLMLRKLLNGRHSPIRVLNFAFLIREIPSNTATHLARHVHAVPFISSLRNDRQKAIDGDNAPRNTPVDMIFYCNAEELMIVANKRLCGKAARKTRRVVRMMCRAAEKAIPELKGLLVPMCEYHGGVCHEPEPCPRQQAREDGRMDGKRAIARAKFKADRTRYKLLKESGDGDAHE